MLEQELISTIQQILLHHFGLRPSKLTGVIGYGSRFQGLARPDSDWDLTVLVQEVPENYSGDYHGPALLGHANEIFEIRIRSFSSACAEVKAGGILRADCLARGQIILDIKGEVKALRDVANTQIEQAGTSFIFGQGMSASDLLSLIQISALEVRNLVLEIADSDPISAFARASEFFLDLYLYTETYLRLRAKEDSGDLSPLPAALLLLAGNRPARLWQAAKYPMEPWFTRVKAEMANAFPLFANRSRSYFAEAFTAVANGFGQRTKQNLFPNCTLSPVSLISSNGE